MKIAVFHFGFFYSGGGEKLVIEQAEGLRQRGHEVMCFAPVVDSGHCFPELLNNFSVELVGVKIPSWWPDWQMLQVLVNCFLFPLFFNRFKDFDVVLAANQPSVFFGWCLNRRWGIPYVAYLAQPTRHLHPRLIDLATDFGLVKGWGLAHFLAKLFRPFINRLDQTSIKEASEMLTNGDYIGAVLENTYQRGRINCPAGAHPSGRDVICRKGRYRPRLKDENAFVTNPYLLITNRHFPQKRFDFGLQALKLLSCDFPNLGLIITGEATSYTRELCCLEKSLGLNGRVKFTGLVSQDCLLNLYQNGLVYLYTAPQEDFGMGVVEAMMAGTPVVAWNEGGPSCTVINGLTGLLARPWRVSDFASKVKDILNASEERYNQWCFDARKHAVKYYSYQRHYEIVENTLLKAAKRNISYSPPK